MVESVIFSDRDVTVTSTLAQIAGVSYPINGIGSVFVIKPRRLGLIIVAVVLAWLGISQSNGLALLAAGVLAMIAIARQSTLVIRTASGDQAALRSRSDSRLQEVKLAIERAVAIRG